MPAKLHHLDSAFQESSFQYSHHGCVCVFEGQSFPQKIKHCYKKFILNGLFVSSGLAL
jgi:hypothetical protein